jgi:hypothetical protein
MSHDHCGTFGISKIPLLPIDLLPQKRGGMALEFQQGSGASSKARPMYIDGRRLAGAETERFLARAPRGLLIQPVSFNANNARFQILAASRRI